MWPPHPHPLAHNGVLSECSADCGGEGAESGWLLTFLTHTPLRTHPQKQTWQRSPACLNYEFTTCLVV